MLTRRLDNTWHGVIGARLGLLAVVLHLCLGVAHANAAIQAASPDGAGPKGLLAGLTQICSQSGLSDEDAAPGGDETASLCGWCCPLAFSASTASAADLPAWPEAAAATPTKASRVGGLTRPAPTRPRGPPAWLKA